MVSNPSDAEVRDLLQRYRRIAVVGLSDKPDRPSHGVAAYLQRAGYDIIPVNPMSDEALGVRAVDALSQIEQPVEIVDVFRRADDVPLVVDSAIAAGAKVLWLQLGIVNETAAQRAREAGMIVIQDRCLKVEHARVLGRG